MLSILMSMGHSAWECTHGFVRRRHKSVERITGCFVAAEMRHETRLSETMGEDSCVIVGLHDVNQGAISSYNTTNPQKHKHRRFRRRYPNRHYKLVTVSLPSPSFCVFLRHTCDYASHAPILGNRLNLLKYMLWWQNNVWRGKYDRSDRCSFSTRLVSKQHKSCQVVPPRHVSRLRTASVGKTAGVDVLSMKLVSQLQLCQCAS